MRGFLGGEMSDVLATFFFGGSYWVGKSFGPEVAMVFWMLGILIFFVIFDKYLRHLYNKTNKSVDN